MMMMKELVDILPPKESLRENCPNVKDKRSFSLDFLLWLVLVTCDYLLFHCEGGECVEKDRFKRQLNGMYSCARPGHDELSFSFYDASSRTINCESALCSCCV